MEIYFNFLHIILLCIETNIRKKLLDKRKDLRLKHSLKDLMERSYNILAIILFNLAI